MKINKLIDATTYLKRAGLAILMSALSTSVYAQVSGLNYSLSPIGERIIWAENSGLTDGYVYGGKIGIGFGQYVELEGIYQFGNDFRTAPQRITQDPDVNNLFLQLPEREIQINKYGLNTKVNLTSRALVPYLSIGAGLLELKQDNHINNRSIYYAGGAGLMTTIASRYSLFAELKRTGYRLNTGNLYTDDDLLNAGIAHGSFNEVLNHSWNVQVGLKAYLGGSRFDDPSQTSFVFLDQFNGGLYNTRFIVSPLYGQIYFNESLGMPNTQHITGLSAGFEFGPHVTLQGFYWKGLNDEDSFDFEGISMVGAELKTSFFRSNITPYLTIGAGYLSLDDDYRPELIPTLDSQIFGLAGLGIDIHLSRRVTIDGAVRTMINSMNNPEPGTWNQNFEFSPMFTTGVTVKIGTLSGRRAYERTQQFTFESESQPQLYAERTKQTTPESESDGIEEQPVAQQILVPEKVHEEKVFQEKQVEVQKVDTRSTDLSPAIQLAVLREAALTEQIASAVAEGDSVKTEFLKSERNEIRSQLMAITAQKPQEKEKEVDIRTSPVLEYRTFTLPVLEEGEIYIRFGKPEPRKQPAVSEPFQSLNDIGTQTQDLENIVSRLLDEYLIGENGEVYSDTVGIQLREMEERLNRLMEALESRPQTDENINARFESFEQKFLELLERQSSITANQQTTTLDSPQNLDLRFDEFEKRMLDIIERQNLTDRNEVRRESQMIPSSDLTRDTSARDLQGIALYTGVSYPFQMLLGLRADYGSILGDRLQIMPEFTYGFGKSTKLYNINMNMIYNLDFIRLIEPFEPYAGVGVGILAFTNPPENLKGIQLTGSVILGVDYHTNSGAWFVEYVNQSLFKINRLHIGYRFRF